MKKITYLYFNELASTNNQLLSIASKSEDFTVVYTHNQTQGRGYGQNKWLSKPKENLTFSFLLSFDLNDINNILAINFWVITQLHSFIQKKISDKHELKIKWPNDLIINKKKVAGILIENKISGKTLKSIIGIGINVNQKEFQNLQNSTSLFIETKKTFDLKDLLTELMNHFLYSYHTLKDENNSLAYFNTHLFMKNEVACFEKNREKLNGIIQNVSKNGELCVLHTNDLVINYKHKEIALLF
jgi:BirA family transcriptional regulator, biotin operon repressor / biotin---[acetyl-CoA-carboxylase] ligase